MLMTALNRGTAKASLPRALPAPHPNNQADSSGKLQVFKSVVLVAGGRIDLDRTSGLL